MDLMFKLLLKMKAVGKHGAIIPIRSQQIPDVLNAKKDGLAKMHGKPKDFYIDIEGAVVSDEIQKLLKKKDSNTSQHYQEYHLLTDSSER